jgi:hypothetical protein
MEPNRAQLRCHMIYPYPLCVPALSSPQSAFSHEFSPSLAFSDAHLSIQAKISAGHAESESTSITPVSDRIRAREK